MKAQYRGILAYTLASAFGISMIVACGQSKSAVGRVSKISVQQTPTSTATSTANLRFVVTVSDQKPLISLMQLSLGDQVNTLVNNPKAVGPAQETVNMDLSLTNLTANSVGTAGDGSVLKLKAVLSNSVDQPISLLMASKSATVNVTTDDNGQTKMTARFIFLPEYSMQTSSLTLVLDGAITTNYTMVDAKVYSGTLAVVDDSNQSAVIGTFSMPLSQIVSADDAARLGNTIASTTTSTTLP